MPDVSVILPCYNESGNLLEILSRYRPLVSKIGLELVLVDNGSTDQTATILDTALRLPENSFVKVVKVLKNIGYGHGIKAGLQAAQGSLLAISHADLQCNPEDLLTAMDLYKRYEKTGPILVKGRRHGARAAADRAVTWIYNHLAASLLHLKAFFADTHLGLHALHAADINAQPKLFPRLWLTEILQGPIDFTFDLYVLFVAHRHQASLVEFLGDYKTRQWGQSKLAANPWVRFQTSLKAMRYIIQLCLN